MLGDIVIQPSASAKLLGVHLDKGLRWSVQADTAFAKGMEYMMQSKRLSKGKWGVPRRQAAKLFTSVVVPKMLFAAEI